MICFENKEDNDINECLPFCCTCCCLYKENYFENDKEFFCYCYQEKRGYKFFSEFISNDVHKKLVPLLIEYFLLQFMVIGFEEDYQISNINKLNFLFVFIISLLLFFYFSISFYKFIKLWRPVINESSDILSQISCAISDGAHGILMFNSMFSFIFSLYKILNKDKFTEIFINNEKFNNIIYIPIIMNKIYYFTLMYYCISYSEEKKELI